MASSVFTVSIHSDISEFPTEKRYDRNIKISELKKKLELITGANHASMKIFLSIGDKEIGELSNADETLAYYVGSEQLGKDSTLKLAVKDDQPSDLLSGDVPKYTISEEKYKERPNVRDFIKELKEKRNSGEQQEQA